MAPGMLHGLRVLDCTTREGQFAGQLLAQLGADVTLVEPPDGVALRRQPDWWDAYGRGKRSIIVDVSVPAGRQRFDTLVAGADAILHDDATSGGPWHGVDDRALADINPTLIRGYLSPFGLTGPKRGDPAVDLTIVAASGQMAINGDERLPPLRVPAPQAMLNGAAELATGILLALTARRHGHGGQVVDVSAQEAMLACTQSTCLTAAVQGATTRRCADGTHSPPVKIRATFPAADGWVSVLHAFGSSVGPFTNRLMAWIDEEGECPADLRALDWVEFGLRFIDDLDAALETHERSKDTVARFTASRTRDELFEGAQQRKLLIAPVNTLGEVLQLDQLRARTFWDEGPEPGAPELPGPFVVAGATPLLRHLTTPTVGEHDDEVAQLTTPRAPPRVGSISAEPPLAGLRVLDFSWAVAGPSITRLLADFGATVIRVESSYRLDLVRGAGPWIGGVMGVERSAQFHNLNAGKLGITLDLRQPEAVAVVRSLVTGWADVVSESFAPGVMDRLGIGWSQLRTLNPRLVMVSSTLFGQSGPLSGYAGFGNLSTAMSGITQMTGWPGQPPIAPYGAFLDYLSPRVGQIALLAALEHVAATGEGQHLDIAQMEVAMQFLAPDLLGVQRTGVDRDRCGNDDPDMYPHAVYPCRDRDEAIAAGGDDASCHVAIAYRDDEDWRRLSALIGLPGLGHLDVEERRTRAGQIDAALAEFCRRSDAVEVERIVLAADVPAQRVMGSVELVADAHLTARGHWVPVGEVEGAPLVVENVRVHLSGTPGRPSRPGPMLGEHLLEVLQRDAGLSDEEVSALLASGAAD